MPVCLPASDRRTHSWKTLEKFISLNCAFLCPLALWASRRRNIITHVVFLPISMKFLLHNLKILHVKTCELTAGSPYGTPSAGVKIYSLFCEGGGTCHVRNRVSRSLQSEMWISHPDPQVHIHETAVGLPAQTDSENMNLMKPKISSLAPRSF